MTSRTTEERKGIATTTAWYLMPILYEMTQFIINNSSNNNNNNNNNNRINGCNNASKVRQAYVRLNAG